MRSMHEVGIGIISFILTARRSKGPRILEASLSERDTNFNACNAAKRRLRVPKEIERKRNAIQQSYFL